MAEPAATVSDEADNVNAGIDNVTDNINVRVAEPLALVAVIVCNVAPLTTDGVPDNTPVDVLNEVPEGATGDIA